MSALPDGVAEDREDLRRLIELVPDQDVPTLKRIVRALTSNQAISDALDKAPYDDEGDLTDEVIARLEESRQAADRGEVVSHEEVRRRFGL